MKCKNCGKEITETFYEVKVQREYENIIGVTCEQNIILCEECSEKLMKELEGINIQ